jgi:hypothetical protein
MAELEQMRQFDTETLDGIKGQAQYLSEKFSMEGGFEGGDGAWGRAFGAMADWLVSPEAAEYERIPSGKLTELAQEALGRETGGPFDEDLSRAITLRSMTMLACGWAELLDIDFVYADETGKEHIIDKKAVSAAMNGEALVNPVTGLPDEDMDARTTMQFVATDKLQRIRGDLAMEAAPRPGI